MCLRVIRKCNYLDAFLDMFGIRRSRPTPETTPSDIVVFKVLKVMDGYVMSPYLGTKWGTLGPYGRLVQTEFLGKTVIGKSSYGRIVADPYYTNGKELWFSVSEGLHSHLDLTRACNHAKSLSYNKATTGVRVVVAECCIPAGSEVMYGDREEVVSDSLILKRIVRTFNSNG